MIKKSFIFFWGLFLLASVHAHAASITGGSLLTQSYANQLENWLGGSLNSYGFEILFDSTISDYTSAAFHNAVDGQGSTITVIKTLTFLGHVENDLIGGYNSRSWSSDSQFHTNPGGFIFNLTDIRKLDINNDQSGQYGTYNHSLHGPTFGNGYDIYIEYYNNNPSITYGYSYGNGRDIFDNNLNNVTYFSIAEYEVYKVGQYTNPIPEPTTMLLVGLGLIGLVGARRKLQKQIRFNSTGF